MKKDTQEDGQNDDCKLLKHIIESVNNSGSQIRVLNRKSFFLFLYQNICCGYSKETSRLDGSFEHPKHMLKQTGKKIITILSLNMLNWNYE